MAKELVFPSDEHVTAICASSKDAAEAAGRIERRFLPSSNATGETKQAWLDGVKTRVDSALKKIAAEAALKAKEAQDALRKAEKPTAPDAGGKPAGAV